MEVLKIIFLTLQIVGIYMLGNTTSQEGFKVGIFIVACLLSYGIFKDALKGIKNRIITDGLVLVMPIVLTALYSVIYWGKLLTDAPLELPNADALYITTLIGMAIYMIVKWGDEMFLKKRRKAANLFIRNRSEYCIKYSDGKGIKIKVSDINPGDVIILRQGEEIVFDGVVIKGESVVYEGIYLNKRYVYKTVKDEVLDGSINCDGAMYVKVTRTGRDTVLGNTFREVKRATAYKRQLQDTDSDSANGWIFLLQMVYGIIVFLIYTIKGNAFCGIRQAGLSACVMMPVIFYLGRLFADIYVYRILKDDIYLRGNIKRIMENTDLINDVIVDYDDVFTKGDEEVIDIYTGQLSKEIILQLGKTAISNAKSLSYRAIKNKEVKENPYNLEGFKEYIGRGIDAAVNPGRLIVSVGTKEYMVEKGISTFDFSDKVAKAKNEGKRVIYLAVNKKVEGIFALACPLDASASEMIKNLKEKGIEPYLVTGDQKDVAEYFAKEFEIDRFKGDMLVRNKLDKLDELQIRGNVLVIANGTDNGALLANADLSITTSGNYKDIVDSSDCVIREDKKKNVVMLIEAGRRYNAFISTMMIALVLALILCSMQLSGLNNMLGIDDLRFGGIIGGDWGICIVWGIVGIFAAIIGLAIGNFKRRKNKKKLTEVKS